MSEELKPTKTEKIENSDGTYTVKYVFENNQDYLSQIELYTADNKLLESDWYIDDSFNNILTKEINNSEENTTIIIRYYDEINTYKTEKIFYNEYDIVTKIEYYHDENLEKLYAIEEYEYLLFGIKQKTVFEQEHNGYFSCIEFCNLKGQIYKGISFYDRNYSNIYRTSKIKYLKNDNIIILRLYFKKQNANYFSEIEKFDKNKNVVYKKRYKFKGLLAYILFWFAK
ncbi:hypothetical protein J6E39_07550 [bacterium]|nr:hypothetical protein [bacterium]